MKKLFLLLICPILFLVSCKSEYERNLDKMKNAFIANLKDMAFKDNGTIDIIEFSSINYIIKNENYLDTIRLSRNLSRIEHLNQLLKMQLEIMKPLSQQIRLYRDMFGANDNITQIKIENFKEEQKKFQQYQDSVNYYLKQDSLIELRINNRKNPKPIYYFKAYLKAIFKDNNSNKTENFADTIYHIYNQDFNLVQN